MIVGLYQAPQPGSVQEGIATINAALSAGAQSGADMLVLPEAFLPGYTAVAREIPKAWDEIQEDIANLCRRHKVGLTIGLPEYVEDRLFNSAHAFADDGRPLASYRKIQLFGPDEQALYTAGDAYVTFAFKGTRFGLLICYDAEFPEHVRHLARLGLPSHDKSGWQWIIRSAVVRAADRPGTRSDGLSTHWSGGFVHAT